MTKKYTYAKVSLCIGLLSFHIFSSCVHTRQALGVGSNVREEMGWTLGNAKRTWHAHPQRVIGYAAGGVALFCAGAAGIWGLTHVLSGSNTNALAGGNHSMLTTTTSSICNVTMTAPSNTTLDRAISTWESTCDKYSIPDVNATTPFLMGSSSSFASSTKLETDTPDVTTASAWNSDVNATTPFSMPSVSDVFSAIAQPSFQASTLEEWINHGLDVDLKNMNDSGKTLLMVAAEDGRLDITKRLIDSGANINEKDKQGFTALLHAIFNNRPDIVNILIDNKANLDEKDDQGRTPLLYTVFYDRPDIVNILIDNGVKVDEKDGQGATALMHAARANYLDIAQALIDKGANKSIMDIEGKTALDYAEESGLKGNDEMKALLSNKLTTELTTVA